MNQSEAPQIFFGFSQLFLKMSVKKRVKIFDPEAYTV